MEKVTSTLKRGFTLIELLVVIAIIGLLSSIVLASLSSARQKAKNAKIASEMRQLITALKLYREDNNGDYPTLTNGKEWVSTISATPGLDLLVSGDYIPAIPRFDGFIYSLFILDQSEDFYINQEGPISGPEYGKFCFTPEEAYNGLGSANSEGTDGFIYGMGSSEITKNSDAMYTYCYNGGCWQYSAVNACINF